MADDTMNSLSDWFNASQIKRSLFQNEEFRLYQLKKSWEMIVGPVLARESYVASAKGTTLIVRVTNAPFLHALTTMKGDILKRLKETEYGKRFTDVRFYAGSPKKKSDDVPLSLSAIDTQLEKYRRLYTEKLTEEEIDYLSCWTESHIPDDRLRPLIQKLMKISWEYRKSELKAGWHPCEDCGTLVPPEETLCDMCRSRREKKKLAETARLLLDAPHLQYADVKNLTGCDYSVYERAREVLMNRFREDIFRKADVPLNKRRLLSLLIHKPMKEITFRDAADVLTKLPQTKFSQE